MTLRAVSSNVINDNERMDEPSGGMAHSTFKNVSKARKHTILEHFHCHAVKAIQCNVVRRNEAGHALKVIEQDF